MLLDSAAADTGDSLAIVASSKANAASHGAACSAAKWLIVALDSVSPRPPGRRSGVLVALMIIPGLATSAWRSGRCVPNVVGGTAPCATG